MLNIANMILWKFSFIATLILNNCDSTLGDIVITIKSEEGAPRKYEFTVQSSQSEERPHVGDNVSPHKPLTVYFPPSTISSSTTSTSTVFTIGCLGYFHQIFRGEMH